MPAGGKKLKQYRTINTCTGKALYAGKGKGKGARPPLPRTSEVSKAEQGVAGRSGNRKA
ncbi:MAG: hypothetical protein ACT4ON_00065 [Bacteroidota bacterium]